MDYTEYIRSKQAEYRTQGVQFDPSNLDQRFARYYGTDTRIMVEAYGEIHYGRVGVTTGWKPSFLLMHNSRARGSSTLLGANYKILAVQSSRGKYVYVDSKAAERAEELRRLKAAERGER